MASVVVKSESISDPSIADDNMAAIAQRILVKCEEANNAVIGAQMGEDSHNDGDTSQEQSCAFGVIDKHPPLQHVVSVTGCSATFNIEITGLTYVSVDIVEPYISISKEEALHWLGLLGYKQENMFQIDNETKELVNYSDMSNCTTVSADVQTNRSGNIEVTNPQQEQGLGLEQLDNHNAEENDAGNMRIGEVPSIGDTINCDNISQQQSAENIDSDEHVFKKIKLEKEETDETTASESIIIHQSDEPIKYENYVCDMPSDVEEMDLDSSLTAASGTETLVKLSEDPVEKHDDVATAKDHDYEGTGENDASTSPSNAQEQASDNTKHKRTSTSMCLLYKCTKCPYTAYEFDHLKEHLGTHAKKFKCALCPSSYCRSGHLKRHFLTHAKQRRYKCTECPYTASELKNLKIHARSHDIEPPFKCTMCTYTTSQSSDLNKHLESHMPYYKCTICSYITSQSSDLKMHAQSHRPYYKCTECRYTTSEVKNLKIHIQSHAIERPFKCTICSYTTSESSDLNNHLKRHTPYYKCSKCPYTTSKSSDIRMHRRSHDIAPPFKCTICCYTTSELGDLEMHAQSHNIEPPYQCSICSFKTCELGDLNKHLKSHLPYYKCIKCPYITLQSALLNKHLQNHGATVRQEKCTQCDYAASRPDLSLLCFKHGF